MNKVFNYVYENAAERVTFADLLKTVAYLKKQGITSVRGIYIRLQIMYCTA